MSRYTLRNRAIGYQFVRRLGLERPRRRNKQRSLLPLVGDGLLLQEKDAASWRGKQQVWADAEIGLGVCRCPATYGDHQWPTTGQKVRIQFSMRADS
jgi:hypothetical protein